MRVFSTCSLMPEILVLLHMHIMVEWLQKGWCPTGVQGSPSELIILRLLKELNPETFDRQL
jgi:hypothetical protein